MNGKNLSLEAKGQEIAIIVSENQNDFISLTDIAKYKNNNDPRFVIQN